MTSTKALLTEIEQKLDIVTLIGSYVSLQRKGERYWACCPFHQERSPSFTVDPHRKRYHCFGCQEKGDLFNFYMAMEGVSFKEALVVLAQRAGVTLEAEREEVQREAAQRKSLQELYQKLTNSFEYLLWNSARGELALRYLTKRGVSESSLKTFRVGYGMHGYQELYQFLTKRGYSEAFLRQSGLFSSKNVQYSLFRDRIMFPLIDVSGFILAYSGRAMPDADEKSPKYINSPETVLFSKRKELFGMAQAKESIRKDKHFILCEGAMDVIALHQMGHPQAVAPLGSAVTEEQIQLIKRFSSSGTLLMDADAAGQKAMASAALLFEAQEMVIRAVRVHTGKDPSECLELGQEEILTKSIKSATMYFDFLLQESFKKVAKDDVEQKLVVSRDIFAYINVTSSPVKQESYLKMLAQRLNMSFEAVEAEFERFRAGQAVRVSAPSAVGDMVLEALDLKQEKEVVLELITACLMQPQFYLQQCKRIDRIDFDGLGLASVYQYLKESELERINIDEFFERYTIDASIKEVLKEKRLSAITLQESWLERGERAMARYIEYELKYSQSLLLKALTVDGVDKDIAMISELQREVNDISSELQSIRGGVHG